MEEISTDPLVPAVKPDPRTSSVGEGYNRNENDDGGDGGSEIGAPDLDKDLLCPICMQIIKDAFLTACGHSFCYMCIITHLRNKSDCPCCSQHLTNNQLYPNFLLDKVSFSIFTHKFVFELLFICFLCESFGLVVA